MAVLYSDILRKCREVRALVSNKKYGSAERAVDALREELSHFIDGTYFKAPALGAFTADPLALATGVVEHAESAHPLTLEIVVGDLHSLLERITQNGAEMRREASIEDDSDCGPREEARRA